MPGPPSPNCHANIPPPTITIRHGQHIWDEFYEELQIQTADTIGFFDKHDVVDELNEDQAEYAGEELDGILGVRTVLLSFGKKLRQASFFQWEQWYPSIAMLDGYIFTDFRECWRDQVDVYREPWMMTKCIGIRGDKGHAAELFNRPGVLFDDKEFNVGIVRS